MKNTKRTYKVYPISGKGCTWLISREDLFKVGHCGLITAWATDGEKTIIEGEKYSTMPR